MSKKSKCRAQSPPAEHKVKKSKISPSVCTEKFDNLQRVLQEVPKLPDDLEQHIEESEEEYEFIESEVEFSFQLNRLQTRLQQLDNSRIQAQPQVHRISKGETNTTTADAEQQPKLQYDTS